MKKTFLNKAGLLFAGSTPNVNSCGEPIDNKHLVSGEKVASYGEIIVEKIHGFGEKLLGHHRSDSDTSTRAKTGYFLVHVFTKKKLLFRASNFINFSLKETKFVYFMPYCCFRCRQIVFIHTKLLKSSMKTIFTSRDCSSNAHRNSYFLFLP